jgi:hypothetical protein
MSAIDHLLLTFAVQAKITDMTVEQTDVVDGIGLGRDGSNVVMLISDHLEWANPDHLRMIGAKVDAYADAAMSGQISTNYPAAKGKAVIIQLVCKYPPDDAGLQCLAALAGQLERAGIGFEKVMLPPAH